MSLATDERTEAPHREAWSPDSLAELYDCSVWTIRRAIKAGELTAFKIGGLVRVTDESRRAWVASKQAKARPA